MGGVTIKFALVVGLIRQVALLGSIRLASGRTPKSAMSTVSRLTRDGQTLRKQHHHKIAVAVRGNSSSVCGWRGQKVMSALPPKAEMCGAARDVRFGPIADSRQCLADLKIKQRWDRSRLENHMRPDKCRPWDRSLLSFFPLFKSARACLAPSFINMSSTTAFHCLPSGFPLSVWVCFCTFAVVALRSAKISTTLLSMDSVSANSS